MSRKRSSSDFRETCSKRFSKKVESSVLLKFRMKDHVLLRGPLEEHGEHPPHRPHEPQGPGRIREKLHPAPEDPELILLERDEVVNLIVQHPFAGAGLEDVEHRGLEVRQHALVLA
jgi:hypothetical protein